MSCVGLLPLVHPGAARAFDWSLKLEPGVAISLSYPQSQLFNVGGAATVKALFGLGPYVDIGPTGGFVGLSTSPSYLSSDLGIAWQVGGGVRFKRPHEGSRPGPISPWVDGDLYYVRTGPLDRFGFAVGAGLGYPLDRRRQFWLGPFVRYTQIVQPEQGNFDNHDAKILIVGLSFEAGSAHVPPVKRRLAEPAVLRCPSLVVCVPIAQLPDRDNDGVPDKFDRCPEGAGPIENQGCPLYDKLIIKEDKLELKEHIQFSWNKDVIDPISYALLDQVVMVLQDNKSFNVRIEGHASADGPDEHNQTLSGNRARAVLDYLVSHGVARERLQFKGFSSSMPLESNVTSQGREANRRVDFKLELIILNKGATP